MKFFAVKESTGKALNESILCMLENCSLSSQDCRDKVVKMMPTTNKKKNVDVQNQKCILNLKALFVTCACP